MKRSVFLLMILTISLSTFSQSHYQRVRIFTPGNSIRDIAAMGIETDHGDHRPGVWLITDLSDSELQEVRNAGFITEIMIDDVVQHYVDQNLQPAPSVSKVSSSSCGGQSGPTYNTPVNFSLGSMGGYFTYQEMLDNLDSMASKYPALIAARQPIATGTTIEGRPVWYVKISDNPNIDEPEPEMLYTALHHSREPASMSQLIFYMWHLLENYGTDPTATYIVDSYELYFVTCVNPDGYLYNEFTDPNGGGMWRKNRRMNTGGSMGVDLNRNYGFNWGYDNIGSSTDGFDETYRGTAPFSEPETSLMEDFVNGREFKIALNYHTYGNLLIYPWGYIDNLYTPDSALFIRYGDFLTLHNGYTHGTANQTVGYVVNGSSDDWMYGEQVSKPKVLAMTPEAGDGNFGFWPPSSMIIPICKDNVFPNTSAALLMSSFGTLAETSPSLFSTTGEHCRFTLTQIGLDTTGTYTVSIAPVTPNIISTGPSKMFSGLSLMQEVSDSIEFTVSGSVAFGDPVSYTMTIDNGSFSRTDTITRTFGVPSTVFSANGSGLIGWTPGQWGVSNAYFVSPPTSITDSPSGDYQDNFTNVLSLNSGIDLSSVVDAKLRFHARWEIEPGYDFVQVQASDDNGNTWTSLCGKYTKPGSSAQISGEPLYDGFQSTWVEEEMDLNSFIGSSDVRFRFVLESDFWLSYDGFYFDDLEVLAVLPTTAPENTVTNFYMYPNPATNTLQISLGNGLPDQSVISIYDMSGRRCIIRTLPAATSDDELDVSGLAPGLYMVELKNSNTILTEKLIIE
jgi:hypothetical protein